MLLGGLLRHTLHTAAAVLSVGIGAVSAATVDGTILILAGDDYDASTASSGLNGYGIPFEIVLVPQDGVTLPTLSASSDAGNYGGIIVVGSVSYDYDGDWRSALTDEQWSDIYGYQVEFHVRLVRLDEFPGPNFGATTAVDGAGCCDGQDEQLISFSDTSGFPTANLKANEGVTTVQMWHYPAVVNDNSTKEIAKFEPSGIFTDDTTAAVINTFDGREQMVFFIGWATDWSATSAYLQHAFIHWVTRGLFVGKRKVHLNPQIDDIQLSTELYLPNGTEFKLRTGDLDAHVTWQADLNSRLPSGSSIKLDFGHNGNGDIIAAVEEPGAEDVCDPIDAVDYPYPPDTPLEFMKPPGTGEDLWPADYTEYEWTATCAALDDFASWFLNTENLNAFSHVSHTFTHEELNNATYHDAEREIQFNQAWMAQMEIDQATDFSPEGIIPPAITGLHNADAIQAWMDNGIKYVVGDNTRPILRNADSEFWPLVSTVESNGYAGLYIVPRWATTIYYNCDTPECTLQEWIDTSAGSGDFANLLDNARATNTRYLLGLQADPYMFHQANMRQTDADTFTVGDQTAQMSLVMTWMETIAQEMARLTDWPLTSLKHDDIAHYFIDRMTLDACEPKLSYTYAEGGDAIASVTVTAIDNTCSVPVPVTIPGGTATAEGGSVTEDQVGSEPLIYWVTLDGSAVTLTLSDEVAV